MSKQNPQPQTWVIEYSDSQRAYNIQQFGDALRRNIMQHAGCSPSDYVIIGVGDTEAEARTYCERLRKIRERAGEIIEA